MKKGTKSETRSNAEAGKPNILTPRGILQHPARRSGGTNVKPITRVVAKQLGIREASRPDNPFSEAAMRISKVMRIRSDRQISSPKPSVRFAFVSLSGLSAKDGKADFIGLCGDCEDGIGTIACRAEFLNPDTTSDEHSCRIGLDVDACRRILYRRSEKGTQRAWRDYKAALRAALDKYAADIVVVNELGIPMTSPAAETEFFTWTKRLAERRKALIIAGSFHDGRTKYNTGYIFSPESPPTGYAFHKQVSATGVKELVSVPPRRKSLFLKAFDLKIAVIICLDLLDYSTISPLVSFGERIDFILVPAHSDKTETLERVASAVSSALPGGVGIANRGNQRIFASLHRFGKLCLDGDVRSIGRVGHITLFDVDREEFKREKDRLQGMSFDLEWLLRYPIIEEV